MALQTEFWVERGMNTAKPSRRALHAEKTMVKTTEAIARALTHNRVYHGCITVQDMKEDMMPVASKATALRDPAAGTPAGTYFCFKGSKFNATEGSALVKCSGCSLKDCLTLLAQAAEMACDRQMPGWLGLPKMSTLAGGAEVADAMKQHLSVVSFEQCHLPHFTVCAPAKSTSHRIEASGWVEARSLGATASQRMRLLHVQCFVLVQRQNVPEAPPLRLAFAKYNPDWLPETLGGGLCYKAPSSRQTRVALVQVSTFNAPCLLVRASEAAGSTLRLVPIHSKRL